MLTDDVVSVPCVLCKYMNHVGPKGTHFRCFKCDWHQVIPRPEVSPAVRDFMEPSGRKSPVHGFFEGPALALPTDATARKGVPVFSGFIAYFPKAIAAVAELSRMGNDQHNPGEPLHWAREKSGDELDAASRHLLDRAAKVLFDNDGCRHSVKLAWRAMANLEKEIEAAIAANEPIFKTTETK